jgi:hypothetical protein
VPPPWPSPAGAAGAAAAAFAICCCCCCRRRLRHLLLLLLPPPPSPYPAAAAATAAAAFPAGPRGPGRPRVSGARAPPPGPPVDTRPAGYALAAVERRSAGLGAKRRCERGPWPRASEPAAAEAFAAAVVERAGWQASDPAWRAGETAVNKRWSDAGQRRVNRPGLARGERKRRARPGQRRARSGRRAGRVGPRSNPRLRPPPSPPFLGPPFILRIGPRRAHSPPGPAPAGPPRSPLRPGRAPRGASSCAVEGERGRPHLTCVLSVNRPSTSEVPASTLTKYRGFGGGTSSHSLCSPQREPTPHERGAWPAAFRDRPRRKASRWPARIFPSTAHSSESEGGGVCECV